MTSRPTRSAVRMMRLSPLVAFALLAACGQPATEQSDTAEAEAVAAFPASLNPFGNGYPNAGDSCLRLGESETTSNWLDDSSILVGCPTAEAAKALGGDDLGQVDGIHIVSVPMGDANAGMAAPPPAPAAGEDPVRKTGGLEDQCKDAVGEVGTKVIGTNRIVEAAESVDVFVNVENGAAPWLCRIGRDGKVQQVMFTGDEGRL